MDKLLSHRIKGFSDIENSRSALKSICNYPIPYVEIDTRVTQDGKIYVYHNSNIKYNNTTINIFDTSSEIIDKITYINGEKILSLDECLNIFSKRKYISQKICIDIKDFGYEKEHHKAIKKYNIENNVIIVSWIPQVLINIARINKNYTLILSHITLSKLGFIGKLISFLMKDIKISFKRYVLLGENRGTDDLSPYKHGYQHALITTMLSEKIINSLMTKNIGICIHKSLLSNKIITFYKKRNILIWVFSTKNNKDFFKYNNMKNVNVIFSDNALAVLENEKR